MYNVLVYFQLFSLLFALFVIWKLVLHHKRASMVRLVMTITALACFLQNIAYIIEIRGSSLPEVLTAIKFEYIGSTLFTLFYAHLVYQYCKKDFPKKLSVPLSILCLGINFAVCTMEIHNKFYVDPKYVTEGICPHIVKTSGPLYFLFPTYALIMCAAIVYTIVHAMRNPDETAKRKSMMWKLMLAPMLPFISLLLRVTGLFATVDPTPTISLYCTTIITLLLEHDGIFDVVFSAREQVLEQSNDALIIFDRKYNLLDANPSALQLFPFLKEPLQRSFTYNIAWFIDTVHLSTKPSNQEFEYKEHFYQCHVSTVPDSDGNISGYAAIIFDVTKMHQYNQKLLEMKDKADSANQAKSDFLANMSHEIRTPMNAIIGLSELILEESVGRKVYDFAQDIKVASDNLLTIVNDVLDVSKIEAGKLELALDEYHPKLIINEAIRVIQVLATNKCLTFQTDLDPELPHKLFGDDLRIKQILLNLLGNAVKFTKHGSISLKVESRLLSNSEEVELTFIISDTGIGIKPENLQRIFDSFQQVDTKKNRQIQGTGLGLTITKELVSMMNGTIQVESTYGEGSTFTVSIRQKVLDARASSTVVSDTMSNRNFRENLFVSPETKILIVDDNKINLKVAEAMLQPYEFDIQMVTSGPDAIEIVKEQPIDMIFMDHMMPVMDGVEATRLIRSTCGEVGKNVIVVALTANALSDSKDMFLANGFEDYLSKPLEPNHLFRVLDQWIPSEKKHAPSADKADALASSSEDFSDMSMKGVNVADGIRRRSKGVEGYLELLEIFYIDGKEKCGLIEDLATKGDIENYVIEVHALKSVAATIGATDLSEKAKKHEFAGKDGDKEFITSNYENLLYDYRQILAEVKRVLEAKNRLHPTNTSTKDFSTIEPDKLIEQLEAILWEVSHFKPKIAATKIDELLRYKIPEHVENILHQCKAKLKMYEDDAVEEILTKTIEELKPEQEG